MPFLATTTSITPFIGLFGTVIGIMMAFTRIGAEGSTSLAVVAPGIADALVATAAGLFAAVPAAFFYNSFTNRVKELAAQMDDFALEFLNISRAELHVMPKVQPSRRVMDRARGASAGVSDVCLRRWPRSTSSRWWT